jgi:hypothetical protein
MHRTDHHPGPYPSRDEGASMCRGQVWPPAAACEARCFDARGGGPSRPAPLPPRQELEGRRTRRCAAPHLLVDGVADTCRQRIRSWERGRPARRPMSAGQPPPTVRRQRRAVRITRRRTRALRAAQRARPARGGVRSPRGIPAGRAGRPRPPGHHGQAGVHALGEPTPERPWRKGEAGKTRTLARRYSDGRARFAIIRIRKGRDHAGVGWDEDS